MSYGRELAQEMEIDAEINYRQAFLQHVSRMMKGLWTTRDGRQISIHDMTVSHINNCIRMLSGNGGEIAEMWVNVFKKELKDRGVDK